MKLCVPVRVPIGLDSCVEPYLPHAEHLLIFDTDTRDIRHVALREYQDQDGAVGARQFDAVLCASFDKAIKEALAEKGILAFGTDARTAGEAIAEFETAISPDCRPEAYSHDGDHSADGYGGGGDDEKGGHDGNGNGGCGGHEHGHKAGGCACGGHGQHQDAIFRKMRADALKIAVSSQNRERVTDHAGRCRKFWVYEIRGNKVDNKTLRELTLEQTLHSLPLGDDHPLNDVHVMITAGMSPFLYQRLQRGGIRPFVTEETDPDKAVQMLLEKVAQA
jgi:predicted Fe-Mo cluster-binding NifX family protein